MKRMTDLLVATLLMVILFLPMLLIAVWIKLDSEGPVLFKQKRKGQYDGHFTIYKFRTMAMDTPNLATDELQNAAAFITKSGHFLRKTSLDELPQLFNILKGDMSFVGPRPALYNQYDLISKREQFNVHVAKPGLTGYAQVNGRDLISDEHKVRYDAYYVQHYSLWFDIKIVCKTVTKVFKQQDIA